MGKSAVKGLFYICLIAATFVLATITIMAAFSGNVAPVDSVIMPLLGLAVPVLLIVNLITALCWALARKRWALIPLVAFFCNWGYLTSVFQLHLPKDKTPAGKYLKIATYNIHNFGGEITGYSCKEIARYMQQEGVDVLHQQAREVLRSGNCASFDPTKNACPQLRTDVHFMLY